MRALIIAVLVVVLVEAANSTHHAAPPPSVNYRDCVTVTYPITNPDAYCTFHGTPMTVGQYAALTVPNAR